MTGTTGSPDAPQQAETSESSIPAASEQTSQSESALVATDDAELTERNRRRKAAILRAVGLDKVPEEQRELALAIAQRYDLDLMLKHLVLIEGRPFITRDALLWVAHRSGQFDGMQLTLAPEIRDFPELGKCWYSETTVWRKDMAHPFTLPGRYPVNGQNKRFGPEMCIKVSESMALRRAFNVSAATVEEQWESVAVSEPEAPKSLSEKVAERAEAIQTHSGPIVVTPVEPEPGSLLDANGQPVDAPSVPMGLVND